MTHGPLRNGFTTLLTLLAGLCAAALPVLAVVLIAPEGTVDLEAYRAAERCPSAPSEPADCLWAQELTVSDVHMSRRGARGDADSTVLTDANGVHWESVYANRGPVVHQLEEGDRVTGTVWRGELTEIAFGDDTQQTRDAPADMRARVLIGALIIAPPGLLTVAVCLWRLSRLPDPEPTEGMRATLSLVVTLFLIGLVCPVLVSGLGENLWAVVAVWLPLAALTALGYRVSVTRRRARAAGGTGTA